MAFLLVLAVCVLLMFGFPVAMTLGGTALLFAFLGILTDTLQASEFIYIPGRIYKIMGKEMLIAIPVFVFMGLMLERSRIAENLLNTMTLLFGGLRGGLGLSVIVVGALLAASTGIVGATVVTMGLLSLPTMMQRGYHTGISTGTICAAGTLGQIIPPSIVLIILADVLSIATTQVHTGNVTVSVTDLFIGALIPGVILVGLFVLYMIYLAVFRPSYVPAIPLEERQKISRKELTSRVFRVLIPPITLIILVLGSIITGVATPTSAASLGAIGAIILAIAARQFSFEILKDVLRRTMDITAMVMFILIGATLFSLVFIAFGGDDTIKSFLQGLPGGLFTAMLIVMLTIFVLGFILDFFEISLVVIPIVGPVLIAMGAHPVWLGILIALNLQTSFLTPPFGFSLFYLRGVAPDSVRTAQIYKGVIPFILIQIIVLVMVAYWQELATWLPEVVEKARKS